jgi:hypothetical protein
MARYGQLQQEDKDFRPISSTDLMKHYEPKWMAYGGFFASFLAAF